MKKSLFIALLICISLKAQSQVFTAGTMYSGYHDVNPDTLMTYQVTPYTHNMYGFNIFGTAVNDIEFIAHGAVSSGGSAAYISVTSLNPAVYMSFGRWDSVFVPSSSTWNVTKVAKPLTAGNVINAPDAVWDNTTLYLTDHSGSGGGNKDVNDWVGGEKYIGLKYQNGSNTDYGWIRVECTTEDSCYVKDYSFSTASTGIKDLSEDAMTVFPNPAVDFVYLKNIDGTTFIQSNLKFTDVYGKEIKFSAETKNGIIEIDLDPALAEGCYLLQYFSNDRIFSRKLIKIAR